MCKLTTESVVEQSAPYDSSLIPCTYKTIVFIKALFYKHQTHSLKWFSMWHVQKDLLHAGHTVFAITCTWLQNLHSLGVEGHLDFTIVAGEYLFVWCFSWLTTCISRGLYFILSWPQTELLLGNEMSSGFLIIYTKGKLIHNQLAPHTVTEVRWLL